MKIAFLVICSQIVICSRLTTAWSLRNLQKNVGNFRVRHVTIYYMRAFLCIESVKLERKIPTLIEATWPENIIPITSKIFPSFEDHAVYAAECHKIQDAIGTSIDRKGRLWVIDNGSKFCAPRLLIYLILPWTGLLIEEPIKFVSDGHIKSILCDPSYNRNSSARAFLSLHEYDFLIVYYLKERRFWKLYFRDHRTRIDYPFKPTEIAWAQNKKTLYISNNQTGELLTINISKMKISSTENMKVPVKYIGKLLGAPRSLKTDPNGALYYIIPRDGVVLRWNGKRPINAEKHEILMFNSAEIVQILFGARGSVWLVTADSGSTDNLETGDHCIQLLSHYNEAPDLNKITSSDSDYDYF